MASGHFYSVAPQTFGPTAALRLGLQGARSIAPIQGLSTRCNERRKVLKDLSSGAG